MVEEPTKSEQRIIKNRQKYERKAEKHRLRLATDPEYKEKTKLEIAKFIFDVRRNKLN